MMKIINRIKGFFEKPVKMVFKFDQLSEEEQEKFDKIGLYDLDRLDFIVRSLYIKDAERSNPADNRYSINLRLIATFKGRTILFDIDTMLTIDIKKHEIKSVHTADVNLFRSTTEKGVFVPLMLFDAHSEISFIELTGSTCSQLYTFCRLLYRRDGNGETYLDKRIIGVCLRNHDEIKN